VRAARRPVNQAAVSSRSRAGNSASSGSSPAATTDPAPDEAIAAENAPGKASVLVIDQNGSHAHRQLPNPTPGATR